MTQFYGKARQHAEIAFAKTQTQFLARSRAAEARDAIAEASRAKTLRLKKARLAKELEDRAATTAALSASRALKA